MLVAAGRRLLLTALALACGLSAARAAGPETVVATVNGRAITYAELSEAHQALPDQYRQIPLDIIYTTLLEQMIRGRLLTEEARKQGLGGDPEVKRRVTQFEDQAIQQVYMRRVIDATVGEDAMRARYRETIATLPPQEEVRARHIIVKSEAEAHTVLTELKKGADFAEMAKLYSTDGTATKGGDLGYFRRDDMVEAFADAAFELRAGELRPTPLETEFGWHVIKLDDRRAAPPPSFEELKDGIRQELGNKALASHVGALSGAAKIQRFNADGTPLAAPEERR